MAHLMFPEEISEMKIARFDRQLQFSIIALFVMGFWPACILAQDAHAQMLKAQHDVTADQSKAGALLKIVRDSTARFQDVSAAEAEGYALQFGCVSGPDSGAMGLHFVNMNLVALGVVDATRPQIVIYEPMSDGRVQLIGADYLVLAAEWDKNHPGQPPQLMGQLFHY